MTVHIIVKHNSAGKSCLCLVAVLFHASMRQVCSSHYSSLSCEDKHSWRCSLTVHRQNILTWIFLAGLDSSPWKLSRAPKSNVFRFKLLQTSLPLTQTMSSLCACLPNETAVQGAAELSCTSLWVKSSIFKVS